jgi:hypothetical protein
MNLVLTAPTILLAICIPLLAYLAVKKLFERDTDIENRRRAAAQLAAKLREAGLKKVPDFLIDYSVGDYSGMANKMRTLAELFMAGEDPVLAEVENVFSNLLVAKLQTEEGRAYVAAKLAEVTKVASTVTSSAADVATAVTSAVTTAA